MAGNAIIKKSLTDADKAKIADEAGQALAEEYNLRETVYVGLDGYCYSEDGIAYPISNIDLLNTNLILIYDTYSYTEDGRDFYNVQLVPLSTTDLYDADTGLWNYIGYNAVFYSEYEGSYKYIRGVGYPGADEAITFDVYPLLLPDGYLKEYYGQISVDKEALFGKGIVHIETVTITEEGVYTVERSEAPDGTPYNFKRIEVFVKQKLGANASRGGLSVTTDTGEVALVSPLGQIFSPNYDASVIFLCDIRHGNLYAETTVRTSSAAAYTPTDLQIPSFAVENSVFAEGIKAIKYYSLNAHEIPVGTTIEIWGDYNA